MKISEILKNNNLLFFEDLKTVREVLVYAKETSAFFKITKKELLKHAETDKINYYITDKIFVVRRKSMVII